MKSQALKCFLHSVLDLVSFILTFQLQFSRFIVFRFSIQKRPACPVFLTRQNNLFSLSTITIQFILKQTLH